MHLSSQHIIQELLREDTEVRRAPSFGKLGFLCRSLFWLTPPCLPCVPLMADSAEPRLSWMGSERHWLIREERSHMADMWVMILVDQNRAGEATD